jgi:L-seryl-tRNA(Ser) seleniumtransferase
MDNQALRAIPAVHRFTEDAGIGAFRARLGPGAVRSCVQSVLDEARESAAVDGTAPPFDILKERMITRLAELETEGLLAVVNATGVLLHTNFGRAPLASAALEAVSRLGAGYTNLEYDIETGERGSRYDRVLSQLRELSGAQSALVVNNCAAAVLLVLDTFARGKEVIVSRGQLIEIGGAFRLPDVLAKSGATLVEVGTTNRTYGTDYRNAWTSNTAILMRSHPSNYRVEGFTAEVDASALAAMAKEFSVISFEDLGSGALVDLARFGLPHEPTLAEEIAAGVDIVAVSGDKLLGGPQCGIIAGRRSLIDVMKRNPLLRALRVDKMTLSALSATLSIYLEPERLCEIPFFAMLSVTRDELTARATAICAALRGRVQADVEPVMTSAAIGGGSFPNAEIPSAGVCVHPRDRSVNALCAALRRGRPPIIGRVDERSLTLDLRTVPPDRDAVLADALIAASPCE